MSNARNGKIARLPREIREQLNRRLDDGEEGKGLVDWLNSLPEVQSVLAEQFGGRPVNEQNLSEWRQGGYADWLRHQEAHLRVLRLAERAEELDEAADGLEVSDRLASVLAVELAAAAETLLGETRDAKERWQRLRELLEELRHLRYADHNALRVQIERERWDCQTERQAEEDMRREAQERKQHLLGICFASRRRRELAVLFGDSEAAREWVDLIIRIETDQPLPDWCRTPPTSCPAPPAPAQPDQAESSPIKLDQTA
jgi:hypothetical protein